MECSDSRAPEVLQAAMKCSDSQALSQGKVFSQDQKALFHELFAEEKQPEPQKSPAQNLEDIYYNGPIQDNIKAGNKKLQQKTEKSLSRIASIQADCTALKGLMNTIRAKEKVEKQRLRRLKKKAARMKLDSLQELMELKGMTSEEFNDQKVIEAGRALIASAASSSSSVTQLVE